MRFKSPSHGWWKLLADLWCGTDALSFNFTFPFVTFYCSFVFMNGSFFCVKYFRAWSGIRAQVCVLNVIAEMKTFLKLD